jgi:hypothetical protein
MKTWNHTHTGTCTLRPTNIHGMCLLTPSQPSSNTYFQRHWSQTLIDKKQEKEVVWQKNISSQLCISKRIRSNQKPPVETNEMLRSGFIVSQQHLPSQFCSHFHHHHPILRRLIRLILLWKTDREKRQRHYVWYNNEI